MSDAQLGDHDHRSNQWGLAVGYVLLRASAKVGQALRARFEAIVQRGLKALKADDVFEGRCVFSALDHGLNGPRTAPASREHEFHHLQLWSEATADQLVAALEAVAIDKYGMAVVPRLVLIGGDRVFDWYRKRWSLLQDAAAQRALVEQFGLFTSPHVAPLMQELADKSKAKKLAAAWLAARSGTAAATVKPVGPAAQATPAAVPALQPRTLIAQLDAAEPADWPDFFALNPEDAFHGLRVLGLRDGKRWAIVFERLMGDSADSLLIRRWRFGSDVPAPGLDDDDEPISVDVVGATVTGPKGELKVSAKMVDRATLARSKREPDPEFARLVHGYHAGVGGGWWPDPARAIERARLSSSARVVVVNDAFAHDVKPATVPSQSSMIQSLVAAVASGDGTRFRPGTPNTRYAEYPDPEAKLTAKRPSLKRPAAKPRSPKRPVAKASSPNKPVPKPRAKAKGTR